MSESEFISEVFYITDQGEFENAFLHQPTLVVKLTAPAWCAPCRAFKPKYDEVSSMDLDIDFVSIDIDENQWAVSYFGVTTVPTVLLYRDGEYVVTLQERNPDALLKEINNA